MKPHVLLTLYALTVCTVVTLCEAHNKSSEIKWKIFLIFSLLNRREHILYEMAIEDDFILP